MGGVEKERREGETYVKVFYQRYHVVPDVAEVAKEVEQREEVVERLHEGGHGCGELWDASVTGSRLRTWCGS